MSALNDQGADSAGSALIARVSAFVDARRDVLSTDAHTISAIWQTEYAAQLRPSATPLHLKHVCVQTNAIGSCYFERTASDVPLVVEAYIGQDALKLYLDPLYWKIAALDAVCAGLVSQPQMKFRVDGTPPERALRRAQIVVDEVLRLVQDVPGGSPKNRVLNVGVVGDFLQLLSESGLVRVRATDFYSSIIDTTIWGAYVRDGRFTLDEVASADIALVTGMTLATRTLDDILRTAVENDTRVVLFAETGANFADVYLEAGVDTVISEPFPFYLSGADSCIVKVYRKGQRHEEGHDDVA